MLLSTALAGPDRVEFLLHDRSPLDRAEHPGHPVLRWWLLFRTQMPGPPVHRLHLQRLEPALLWRLHVCVHEDLVLTLGPSQDGRCGWVTAGELLASMNRITGNDGEAGLVLELPAPVSDPRALGVQFWLLGDPAPAEVGASLSPARPAASRARRAAPPRPD